MLKRDQRLAQQVENDLVILVSLGKKDVRFFGATCGESFSVNDAPRSELFRFVGQREKRPPVPGLVNGRGTAFGRLVLGVWVGDAQRGQALVKQEVGCVPYPGGEDFVQLVRESLPKPQGVGPFCVPIARTSDSVSEVMSDADVRTLFLGRQETGCSAHFGGTEGVILDQETTRIRGAVGAVFRKLGERLADNVHGIDFLFTSRPDVRSGLLAFLRRFPSTGYAWVEAYCLYALPMQEDHFAVAMAVHQLCDFYEGEG
jgi:hypothetical protein